MERIICNVKSIIQYANILLSLVWFVQPHIQPGLSHTPMYDFTPKSGNHIGLNSVNRLRQNIYSYNMVT